MINPSALSKEESQLLLDVFEDSLNIYTREQFFSWLQGSFQCLIPNEVLICGVSLKNKSQLHFESFISTRHVSERHVRFVTHNENSIINRVIDAWKKDPSPILISHTLDEVDFGPYRVPFVETEDLLKELELRNIIAHGVSNKDGDVITFFSFSRLSSEPNPKHAYILQLLVPQMHCTLLRVMHHQNKLVNEPTEIKKSSTHIQRKLISSREIEVLRWLYAGKTNSEISKILHLSINTVKNHVHNIIHKLGVENRSQAAIMAFNQELLK